MPRGVLAATTGAVLLVAAIAVHDWPPAQPELDLARATYDLPGWTTTPLRVAMQAGNRLVALLVVVAVALAGRRRAAVHAGITVAAASLVSYLLRHLIDRPRPTAAVLGRTIRDVVDGPGLPSGHTTVAVTLAAVVVPLVPRWAAVLLVVAAVLTCVARVHLGAHWPLDVVAGTGLGVMSGGIARLVPPARRAGSWR